MGDLTFPERSAAIRRDCLRFCLRLAWPALHEVRLPNTRRADILALRRDGKFVCIEIKSGLRDFQADQKWQAYREYADQLFFCVDTDFPQAVLPADVGLIVAAGPDTCLVRDAPAHDMPPARRRVLLQRFASLAALRLCQVEDPEAAQEARAALSVE